MTTRAVWVVAVAAALALGAVLIMDASRRGAGAADSGWNEPATNGAGSPVAAAPVAAAPAAVTRPAVVVYKNPSCTCCTQWIAHVEQAGFQVTAHDVDNVGPIKRQYGVPQPLESCHTAIVGDYVVEGHVPADVIERMLRERPDIAGIAVAGMPVGSPGMEGPNPQRYDVMALRRDGGWSVYERR